MKRSGNDTKTRILAIERMFESKKRLTVKAIMSELKSDYGIKVKRQTVYDDIAALTRFMPIYTKRVHSTTQYCLIKE